MAERSMNGSEGDPRLRGGLDFSQVARHLGFALAAGVVGAAASIVLSIAVDFAGRLSARFAWILLVLPVLGMLSVLLYRALRLPAHLATDTMVDRLRRNDLVPPSLAPGILAGTFLTVLGGGSVGKEAAALQMGASLGALVGRPFKLAPVRRGASAIPLGYAAATGMAACFGALFFAPLGSTMFVLELARFDRAVARHVPTLLVASFAAFGIARATGIGDVIPGVAVPPLSWSLVAQCVLVGLACGAAGTVFGTGLRLARRVVRHRIGRPLIAAAAGGLLFAGIVLAFGWQAFEGTGMPLLRGALAGHAGGADFAVKAALTVLALGFGLKGGEIMPMFTVGALLGCALGGLTGAAAPFSAALGLAAFFAAASRCPLAALLMGAEIFGLAAAPYLALAVVVAYAGSRDVGVFGHGAASELVRLRRQERERAAELAERMQRRTGR